MTAWLCAGSIVLFFVWLLIGLIVAAKDTRPVVEDDGEYEVN